jgi:hypothetical protein
LKALFLLTVSLFYSLYTPAQQQTTTLDNTYLKKLYEDAKAEFARFEKKHGHFTTTPNGQMHYVTWGKPSAIPLVWSHGSLTNALELLSLQMLW